MTDTQPVLSSRVELIASVFAASTADGAPEFLPAIEFHFDGQEQPIILVAKSTEGLGDLSRVVAGVCSRARQMTFDQRTAARKANGQR